MNTKDDGGLSGGRGTRAAPVRVLTTLVAVLTVISVGAVLQAAREVVVPLAIAWLLSYLFGPVVEALVRRKVPAGIAVTVLFVLLFGVLYLGGMLTHQRIVAFAKEFPRYQARLSDILVMAAQNEPLPFKVLQEIDWGREVNTFLLRLSGSFVVFVSKLLAVLIILAFMLLAKPYSRNKMRMAFAPARAEQISGILDSISRHVAAYLGTLFLVSLATGVCVWIALAWLGVDFAMTWGILAFVLNFVPTIGSIVASIPPVLMALVQHYPNYWPAVAVLGALLVIQQAIGSVIAPRLFGEQLNLSPVVVLLSLIFWGWLWGVTGALLAVPITASIRIACEHIEPLRPVSILMGTGRVRGDRHAAKEAAPPDGDSPPKYTVP